MQRPWSLVRLKANKEQSVHLIPLSFPIFSYPWICIEIIERYLEGALGRYETAREPQKPKESEAATRLQRMARDGENARNIGSWRIRLVLFREFVQGNDLGIGVAQHLNVCNGPIDVATGSAFEDPSLAISKDPESR